MMTEVVAKCEVGIDLHTGSDRRTNLPQVRADLDDPRTRELADGLRRARSCCTRGSATARCGTPRASAAPRCCSTRRGEAWRMDEWAIDAGVAGVRRVLAALGMIDPVDPRRAATAERRVPRAAAGSAPGAPASSTSRSSSASACSDGERLGGLFDSFGKRVCAWSTPTATASSSAAPRRRWSTAATRSCTSPSPTPSPDRSQPTAFFTSAVIFFSTAGVMSATAYSVGHRSPSSSCATSLNPSVA